MSEPCPHCGTGSKIHPVDAKACADYETGRVAELEKALQLREEEIAELHFVFDLRWKADMRAIERWRKEAPGRELKSPNHADMVVWLLTLLDETESEADADLITAKMCNDVAKQWKAAVQEIAAMLGVPASRRAILEAIEAAEEQLKEQRIKYETEFATLHQDAALLKAAYKDAQREWRKAEERVKAKDELTDERIDAIVYAVDEYSRDYDPYDYGVPCSVDDMPKIREKVREALKGATSRENRENTK